MKYKVKVLLEVDNFVNEEYIKNVIIEAIEGNHIATVIIEQIEIEGHSHD